MTFLQEYYRFLKGLTVNEFMETMGIFSASTLLKLHRLMSYRGKRQVVGQK